MARPKVTVGIADNYANKDDERIIEFSSGKPNGPGGLISFKRRDDGTLVVSLYQMDEGVTVHVEGVTVHGGEESRRKRKTRVVPSVGDPGKWQAQYYDPDMRLWFDIGDAKGTKTEAEEGRQHYMTESR